MRNLIGVSVAVAVLWIAWQVGARLSSDALSMGIGVLFGVVAGVPAAMASMSSRAAPQPPQRPNQTVIIVTPDRLADLRRAGNLRAIGDHMFEVID